MLICTRHWEADRNNDMEPKLIDINDFEYSGEGFCGKSYFHRTDLTKMVKVYNKGVPVEEVASELDYSRKVYATGIPCPAPGDLITDGEGRYGILFERLQNKVSFSRATSLHPEKVEEYARRFAGMCLKLHSTKVDKTQFPSIVERDLQMLEDNPYFTEDEKRRTRDFLLSVPQSDTAVHGDLQYSNALMTDTGDYFIDLGAFAYGHPYFDLGQVMLSCCISPDDFIREVFHLEPSQSRDFFKYFVKGYFGDTADVDEVSKRLEPFVGLMSLLIEKTSKRREENFHRYLP